MNPKISIIVPIYNMEQYLERCVDSILSQTYKDFEVILVNDGSTDNSDIICDDYAKKDQRIKVIHKRNGGLSSARNAGIKLSKGQWLLFIDSDDCVKQDYVISFFSPLPPQSKRIIIEGQTVISENKTYLYMVKEKIYDEEDIPLAIAEQEVFLHGSCYSKIYEAKIVKEHQILFNESLFWNEDLLFNFEYFKYIEGMIFKSDVGYCYYECNNGLHTKYQTLKTEILQYDEYVAKSKPFWQYNGHDTRTKSHIFYMMARVIRAACDCYPYSKDTLNMIRKHFKDDVTLYGLNERSCSLRIRFYIRALFSKSYRTLYYCRALIRFAKKAKASIL